MGNAVGGYRFKEEDFHDLFIEFYLVNKFIPNASELSRYGLPTVPTIKRRFGLTYNQFLIKNKLPINKRVSERRDKEEMIGDLRKLAEEMGRVPITEDLTGRDWIRGKGTYIEVFGTWSKALKLAGLEPSWCPVSDEELIGELIRFHNENGRSPSTRDRLRYGWSTFSNRFGTWNKALTVAGLPHNENIYGIRTIGKDGFEYDSISESKIGDWLFDNGIEYENQVPYFDKMIADFKVGDMYIEYFGLHNDEEYMKKARLKQVLCERQGKVLIALYEKDLDKLEDRLGFLKYEMKIIDDSREEVSE